MQGHHSFELLLDVLMLAYIFMSYDDLSILIFFLRFPALVLSVIMPAIAPSVSFFTFVKNLPSEDFYLTPLFFLYKFLLPA